MFRSFGWHFPALSSVDFRYKHRVQTSLVVKLFSQIKKFLLKPLSIPLQILLPSSSLQISGYIFFQEGRELLLMPSSHWQDGYGAITVSRLHAIIDIHSGYDKFPLLLCDLNSAVTLTCILTLAVHLWHGQEIKDITNIMIPKHLSLFDHFKCWIIKFSG